MLWFVGSQRRRENNSHQHVDGVVFDDVGGKQCGENERLVW